MFSCSICHRYDGHDYRCPNYKAPLSNHECVVCNENINIGEEYIVNDNKDYAHWDCFGTTRGIVKFLGYEILEMDDNDDD